VYKPAAADAEHGRQNLELFGGTPLTLAKILLQL
jgi:hypothetical protein